MKLEALGAGLYRLLIPFEDLTTTVYIVKSDFGAAIIDSATYPSDVDGYILPALDALCLEHNEIKYLLLTHEHGDHAGGVGRLSERFPKAPVRASFDHALQKEVPLSDGEVLLDRLQVISLPGHTKNSVGYLDIPTKTLLSGDCLQLRGIGKYRNGVRYPELYIQSIEKLKHKEIDRIIAAHEYDPLGSVAEGKCEVGAYLEKCLEVLSDRMM
ncbi:MAG: MBL fold metallo-hydrolase [Clostridia bacterium]|nr:MBL fold metallo-hydrolase [Clostridia bacterium]